MRLTEFFRCRKSERGAAMLEAMLAMFLLLLVLCGFLHLVYFYIAQYFLEYAAIRGARSYAVGFSDYLSNREARIYAIGASGKMVIPEENNPVDENGDEKKLTSNNTREKTLIQRYMTGYTYIEYKNWNGYIKDGENDSLQTYFRTAVKNTGSNQVSCSATFENYAFFEKFTRYLFFGKNLNLTGSAKLTEYSKVYLE